jgi:hypothetical protein
MQAMSYTILFYAMDAEAFGRRLSDSPAELLDAIDQRLRERSIDEPVRASVLEATRAICRREIPELCGAPYFDALCWLAEVTSERIQICPFQEFNRLSYLEATAIWPLLARFAPPWPVPRGEDDVPQVGFLPAGEIAPFALAEFSRLPPTDDRDLANARDEFRDVLETLVPDGLDLLAVLV